MFTSIIKELLGTKMAEPREICQTYGNTISQEEELNYEVFLILNYTNCTH